MEIQGYIWIQYDIFVDNYEPKYYMVLLRIILKYYPSHSKYFYIERGPGLFHYEEYDYLLGKTIYIPIYEI